MGLAAVERGGLRVTCTGSELVEDGEVIVVGDRVSRRGVVTGAGDFYGTDLDDADCRFDRYAFLTSRDVVDISGEVVAIAAIYVELTRGADASRGWAPRPGSAVVEPLRSTADTRQPLQKIRWNEPTAPDSAGRSYRSGFPTHEEGDESFSGWLFTLDDWQIVAVD